ncbi:MAG: hypothetical protein ACE5KI_06735 [Dehalococcoidia bacterium]
MNRKLIILIVVVVAVVAIVAIFAVLFLGAFSPPVDVYARPTPSISENPVDLLPGQVAGNALLNVGENTFANGIGALGSYEGGIEIQIERFSSSGAAASDLNAIIAFLESQSGSMTSVNLGEQHWFTFNADGASIFGWRKGAWVFVVFAPNEALRNQVAQELPF